MNHNILPLNIPIKPIERISPSRYYSLTNCILKEVLSTNREISELLPISPSIRLGIVIHNIIELASDGKIHNNKDFLTHWDNEIKKFENIIDKNPMERHLIPLSNSVYNFQVKKYLCEHLVERFYKLEKINFNNKDRCSNSEVAVESKNKKIFGKIDFIRTNRDGIQLIDYKTGNIFKEGDTSNGIKQEYQKQLKLYAALYFETFGFWPNKLTIITLDQNELDVLFDINECIDLLEEATNFLDEVNSKIIFMHNIEDLANPLPTNCNYCTYRPACLAYWRLKDNSKEWPIDLKGEVIDVNLLNNGTLRIVIKNSESEINIRGLSLNRNSFLLKIPLKTVISIYNLVNDFTENCYKQGLLTTCYLNL